MNTWSVIQALFFLQSRSLWNRLRTRIRRLRQPKYLVGAVVGLAYFYIYVGRFVLGGLFFPRSGTPGSPMAAGFDLNQRQLLEGMAATGVFFFMLGAWVFAGPRSALAFTETELAHLLPAPISRRTLIRYKLASLQTGLLISSLVLWFLAGRLLAGGHALLRIGGWWVVLAALSLHALGASFVVQRLTERGLSSWLRRTLGCLVGFAVGGALVWWSRSTFLAEGGIPSSFDAWRSLGHHAFTSGPAPWLLGPFRLLVRPWLATSGTEFAIAIGPALLVLAGLFLWVDRSDVAFEEASLERARRWADRIADASSRQHRVGMPKPTVRPAAFSLRPEGNPAVALAWKHLIELRFRPRNHAIAMGVFVLAAVGIRVAPDAEILESLRNSAALLPLGMACIMPIFGVMEITTRVRQDLRMVDHYKTMPLTGQQFVVGEFLGGVGSTVCRQVVCFIGVALFAMAPDSLVVPWPILLGVPVALLTVGPGLIMLLAILPVAAALLFPAWMQSTKDGPGPGLEATGQRVILAVAQLITLSVSLIPVALVSVGMFWLGLLVSPWVAFVLAGAGGAAILYAEIAVAIVFLGKAYDAIDVSQEQ